MFLDKLVVIIFGSDCFIELNFFIEFNFLYKKLVFINIFFYKNYY